MIGWYGVSERLVGTVGSMMFGGLLYCDGLIGGQHDGWYRDDIIICYSCRAQPRPVDDVAPLKEVSSAKRS